MRVARPYGVNDTFHVWQNGAKQSTIALKVFSLPSALSTGNAITGEFKFTSASKTTETKSVSTTASAADAAGARTIAVPLPADLPSFCAAGCSATLLAYPADYSSKVVRLPVQFFNYVRPAVKSVFPLEGSEQGGTLVSIAVEDYQGNPTPPNLNTQHTLPLSDTHALSLRHTHPLLRQAMQARPAVSWQASSPSSTLRRSRSYTLNPGPQTLHP